jgi:hypothetical protein
MRDALAKNRGRRTPSLRLLQHSCNAAALGLLALLAYGAWRNVSQAFDVWYYHVPFAARLVGLVGADEFEFSAVNSARYAGFPLLGELLQGVAYAISGRPQGANLVAFAALFAFLCFIWRRFEVQFYHATIGLLAIPMVQMHATSAYVDLPANLALTAAGLLLLKTPKQLGGSPRAKRRDIYWAIALLAVASNMRFQLVPALTVLLAVWLCIALRNGAWRGAVLLVPLVYATPLKNVLIHGNPVFPVEFHLFGKTLPFVEPQYAEKPLSFKAVPEPLLWVRSVFELDLDSLHDPTRATRWSIDQYAPAQDAASRMGGFFGWYMVGVLLALWLAWTLRAACARRAIPWRAVALGGGATCIAALSPQAHELRYYMFWSILMVSLALIALRRRPWVSTCLFGAAFALVLAITNGAWFDPRGKTFAEFVAARAPANLLPTLDAGATLCVDRAPFNFLFSARFQPGTPHYRVREEADDVAAPCACQIRLIQAP